MKDLWPLLLSAQDNIAGIPSAFLEQKKEEIRQRQVIVQNRIQLDAKYCKKIGRTMCLLFYILQLNKVQHIAAK